MRRAFMLVSCGVLVLACEQPAPVTPGPTDEGPPAKAPPSKPGDGAADEPAEPAKPPGPPPREQAALALLTTIESLGTLHETNADDCGALAAALETFHAEHGAALAAAEPETMAWIDGNDEARARMRTAMNSVMTASMGCREHPEFDKVQVELFGSESK